MSELTICTSVLVCVGLIVVWSWWRTERALSEWKGFLAKRSDELVALALSG